MTAHNAETVRHKIVERWTGGGMIHADRCLCGWQATSPSCVEIEKLSQAHIDGTPDA